MGFLIGRSYLISAIRNYLNTHPDTQEILFHGIMDKEILYSTVAVTSNIERDIAFKVIIPRLKDFRLINWFQEYKEIHNHYEIRSNPKCYSQFIVIDNMFIFVSGNSKDNLHTFNEQAIGFTEEADQEACDQLKAIFLNSWNGGFRLKL
ncbi:hypothetical protein Amet_4417 [Alkaliphilus metalliredigens QYMF]|uniref:PLD phosphodiesterase domain-containing protein n=1 Tax=Alkaliphilus metalliredigens (strain QYMF) TaxID=293826 RepID=A6TWC1_ALKMQ|nr:hypothetical protein [Alkaliphilus metalliredigens]ABR50489.1 hypothetical protein Amet_4417 [Alkaliphilus metalliredigens QYMF]